MIRIGTGAGVYQDDQIKSLSFAPEIDPTLSTIPVCEFATEVVDSEHSEADMLGTYADILVYFAADGKWDYLASEYHIVTATRKSPTLMYFKAQSALGYLNDVYVPDKYYPIGTKVKDVLDDLFNAADVQHGSYELNMIRNTDSVAAVYLPVQRARERLLWLCQAFGLYVAQWGNASMQGLYIRDLNAALDASDQNKFFRTIPVEHTFDKPTIKKIQAPNKVSYTVYSRFEETKPGGTNHNWQTVEAPLLDEDGAYQWVDLDTGEHSKKLYYYYQEGGAIYRTASDYGSESSITDNRMVTREAKILNLIRNAWFREYEVEIDILGGLKRSAYGGQNGSDNDQYYFLPGEDVWFYVDPKTVYRGTIKSARFTFGTMCRQHLVISTDLTPDELYHLEIRYVYKQGDAECLLGRRDYYLQPYITIPGTYGLSIQSPTFSMYVVDRLERFFPQTASVSGNINKDTSVTVYYTRAT